MERGKQREQGAKETRRLRDKKKRRNVENEGENVNERTKQDNGQMTQDKRVRESQRE